MVVLFVAFWVEWLGGSCMLRHVSFDPNPSDPGMIVGTEVGDDVFARAAQRGRRDAFGFARETR